ncbi:MAG: hypothetical protein OXG78_01815 [Chloroflexi bacterium]|nr:hypothetical protein [Chloroflexota bacterium]
MSRKRKGRRRRLNMYQVFGAHMLLFLGVVILLVLTAPARLSDGFAGGGVDDSFNLQLFSVFSLWVIAFYLHAGFVVLATVYRLLRRLLYDQPERERRRDAKIDRLLDEVAELREAVRGTGLVYASSDSEERAERLGDEPSQPGGELDFADEAEIEAGMRLN